MDKKTIVSALVAAVVGSGIPAFAQQHDYRNDRDSNWQQQQGEREARQLDRRADGRDNGWQDRSERRERRGDGARGGWGRTADFNAGYDGAGPNHDLRRGQRLPSRYRTHQYVVDNYRSHRLSAPPRGYHWVQTGADYVLVGAATGIIAQVMLGN
ncbi:MAG: RcnB family protein [Massilia sp.]